VPADTPFLPMDLAAKLGAAVTAGATAAVPESAGRRHHVVGLWPVAKREELRQMVVERGVRRAEDWAMHLGALPVVFADSPLDPFFNVNTPGDLAAAAAMLHGKAPQPG
jgi:molybdopterin-guanine dinucleotide biosynthesis protein A